MPRSEPVILLTGNLREGVISGVFRITREEISVCVINTGGDNMPFRPQRIEYLVGIVRVIKGQGGGAVCRNDPSQRREFLQGRLPERIIFIGEKGRAGRKNDDPA